jgi:hypothetical protein
MYFLGAFHDHLHLIFMYTRMSAWWRHAVLLPNQAMHVLTL